MALIKEQVKAPEKIQLSNKEITNLSDAQVIRKLTELVEFGHKLDEKMKAMLSEIKKNVQATNSDGREMDSNQRCGPEERKTHPTRKE